MKEGCHFAGNLAADPCLKLVHALAESVLKAGDRAFQASEA